MPRRPRVHVPGGMYHVTLRGNHRQVIFRDAADRSMLDGIVRAASERAETRVLAYCWMSNHIHLVVRVTDRPLGRFMQPIGSTYARYLQKAVGTTGHLFERRYHAVLILKPHQLLHTVRYVHLNPVRAGLVTRPGDYPWSSHRCYLGTIAKPWVDADTVLASLASERGEAQHAFAEFCGEAVRRPECMDVARDMLGRSASTDASPGETSHKPLETLEQIVREVCECHGVSEARLMAQGKNHWLSAVRAEIAVRATAEGVASLGVVARRLNRHTSSLARAAARWRRTHSSAECNTTNPAPLLHKGYAF